jgi:hypothetical protein
MLKLLIEQDSEPINPRDPDWCEHFGTMVCFHGRYDLGDSGHGYDDVDEFKQFIERDDVISLPLYLFDHGGITMNTTGFSCPWDSGQVGEIFVTKEQIRKEFNLGRVSKEAIAKACEILKSEVEEYDKYLTGDVYGYRIVEVDEDDNEVDEHEAVWGFYGEDYCKSEGEEALKHMKKSVA